MSVQDGKIRHGQLYDRRTGAIIPFTEQMDNFGYGGTATGVGVANTEVIPHDANASQVRTFDPTAIAAALAGVSFYVDKKIRLDIPDELTGISVTFNTSQGEGSETQTGDVSGIGTSISGSLSLPAKSTSSVSIIPEIVFDIKPWSEWAKRVPVRIYYFYLPGNVSYSAIKTKTEALVGSAVNDWPAFRPKPLHILASGKQISLSASAAIHQSVTLSPSETALMWTEGSGSSYEVGNSVKDYIIPPTIHNTLTIAEPLDSVTIAAAADVSWPDETNWPARSSSISVSSGSVTGYVTPSTFAATTPVTVPTSDIYIYDYDPRPDQDGHSIIEVTTVDMSFFA